MLLFLTVSSNISVRALLSKIIIVSPFVIFIGILNPLFDKSTVNILSYNINGGIVSFISIMLKFTLTVWASFLLIYTTKFINIVDALKELKVPNILANQFYFLYRYIILFLKETISVSRARVSRLGIYGKLDIKIFATLAGTLFMRSVKRSNNIYNSMLARGFNGDLSYIRKKETVKKSDIIFISLSIFLYIFFRLFFGYYK